MERRGPVRGGHNDDVDRKIRGVAKSSAGETDVTGELAVGGEMGNQSTVSLALSRSNSLPSTRTRAIWACPGKVVKDSVLR